VQLLVLYYRPCPFCFQLLVASLLKNAFNLLFHICSCILVNLVAVFSSCLECRL
jgi:hypothetical protein